VEENVEIARTFQPMSAERMAQLEALAAPYAADALFFRKGAAGFGAGEDH
jgi:hypothetical protein